MLFDYKYKCKNIWIFGDCLQKTTDRSQLSEKMNALKSKYLREVCLKDK